MYAACAPQTGPPFPHPHPRESPPQGRELPPLRQQAQGLRRRHRAASGQPLHQLQALPLPLAGSGGGAQVPCRSYGGFNLFAALESCRDLLVDFGGHELAAGFNIREGDIPAFRRRMNRCVRDYCNGEPPAGPRRTPGRQRG